MEKWETGPTGNSGFAELAMSSLEKVLALGEEVFVG